MKARMGFWKCNLVLLSGAFVVQLRSRVLVQVSVYMSHWLLSQLFLCVVESVVREL